VLFTKISPASTGLRQSRDYLSLMLIFPDADFFLIPIKGMNNEATN